MKVLVIGSGGCEYVIVDVCVCVGYEVLCIFGNFGIVVQVWLFVLLQDVFILVDLVVCEGVDVVIVGFEVYFVVGVVDECECRGVFVFGLL